MILRNLTSVLLVCVLFAAGFGVTMPLAYSVGTQPSNKTDAVVRSWNALESLGAPEVPVHFQLQGRLIWRNPSGYFRLKIPRSSRSFLLESTSGPSYSTLAEASVGDVLEVRGHAKPSTPMEVRSVELVEKGTHKDLKKVPLFRDSKTLLWHYVQHMGFVREVLKLENGFRLSLGNKDIVVVSHETIPADRLHRWLGEIVRVEGTALAPYKPPRNQEKIIEIGVVEPLSQITQLKFLKPRAKPKKKEEKPTVNFQNVLVEHVGPTYIVADGRRIMTGMIQHLWAGNVVNIQANPSKTAGQFDAFWIENVGWQSPGAPPEKTPQQIIDENYLNQRVSINGIVSHCFVDESELQLTLQSNGQNVKLAMPLPEEPHQIDRFTQRAVVNAVGLVDSISPNSLNVIRLDVSSSRDVVISETPLLFPARLVYSVLICTAVIAFLLLGWYWTLKQQVHKKTRQLSSSTNRMIAASQAARDGMLIFDADSCVSLVSNKVKRALGCDIESGISQSEAHEIIRERIYDDRGFSTMWNQTFNDPQAVIESAWSLKSDGYVEIYSAPIFDNEQRPDGRIWTFENTTQRRKLEDEMLQSRKLSAVGRLAGGVAHDFNNLLQVIGANLALMQQDGIEGELPSGHQPLEEVAAAVNRGADLTRQLLTFARTSIVECVPSDINHLLQQTAGILDRTLGDHIRLSLSLAENLPPLEIDPGQLEQVVINMCLNAKHAIGRKSGCIQISTRYEPDRHPRPPAIILIRDDGCGMPAEITEKIFEPFFTTKNLDEGSGLGLASSLGAIEQMGGHIECSSTVGQGTEFRIYLPCSSETFVAAKTSPPAGNLSDTQLPLSVLVVDDNAAVRTSVGFLLSQLGHHPAGADGGKEALRMMENESFDVVLLDLSMPEMSGWQVLQIIREQHPSRKVIVCSGYASEPVKPMPADIQPEAYLDKPFQLADLQKVLASVS